MTSHISGIDNIRSKLSQRFVVLLIFITSGSILQHLVKSRSISHDDNGLLSLSQDGSDWLSPSRDDKESVSHDSAESYPDDESEKKT